MTAKNFEDFFASGGTTADLLYDLGRGYCVVERAALDAEWRAYKGDSPPAATAAPEEAPPAAAAAPEEAPPVPERLGAETAMEVLGHLTYTLSVPEAEST